MKEIRRVRVTENWTVWKGYTHHPKLSETDRRRVGDRQRRNLSGIQLFGVVVTSQDCKKGAVYDRVCGSRH